MSRILFNGIKPLVAFVLGGPGSGDLLRAERNSPNSKHGEMIERCIQEGRIVPVEVTCSLLEKAMDEHCYFLKDNASELSKTNGDVTNDNLRGKFLIDGFPRNEDNLQGWTKQMADKVEVMFVLFLDCPHDVCIKRCLTRGQQGSNRSDDNEESLKKRLVTYSNDTMPIIEHYRKLNLLKTIDATKTPELVYADVRELFLKN